MDRLPTELLLEITSYLDTLDRFYLKLAGCRYVTAVIRGIPRPPVQRFIQDLERYSSMANSKQNALHLAASRGHHAMVKYLLKHQAHKNTGGLDGRMPVHFAAENGHKGIVEMLLELAVAGQAPLMVRDDHGRTPLHMTAIGGKEETSKLLLEKGAKLLLDDSEKTPLHYAAEEGHEAVVRLLSVQKGVLLDSREYKSKPPLTLAAGNGHVTVVKYLLELGAKVFPGALHYAAGNEHNDIVELLLEAYPKAIAETIDGETALHFAAKKGRRKTAELLLRSPQVEVDARDNEGRTPLFYAAGYRHTKMIFTLLERRADIHVTDFHQSTLLHRSAYFG